MRERQSNISRVNICSPNMAICVPWIHLNFATASTVAVIPSAQMAGTRQSSPNSGNLSWENHWHKDHMRCVSKSLKIMHFHERKWHGEPSKRFGCWNVEKMYTSSMYSSPLEPYFSPRLSTKISTVSPDASSQVHANTHLVRLRLEKAWKGYLFGTNHGHKIHKGGHFLSLLDPSRMHRHVRFGLPICSCAWPQALARCLHPVFRDVFATEPQ